MGRKKRKQVKPWCWYCNREFDDEKILVQHQKAKHFKCPFCHRKLYTGPGLSIHCNQVHKEKLDKIPNSLPNRSSTVIDIYGMAGIPEGDLMDHERQKLGGEDDEPEEKMARLEEPSTSYAQGFFPPHGAPFMPPPPPPVVPVTHYPAPPSVTGALAGPSVDIPTPTFPAYSAPAEEEPPAKVPKPSIGANGVPVELIHPDDDLPLEELRLRSPKYKRLMDLAKVPIQPPPMVPPMPPMTVPPLPQGMPPQSPFIPPGMPQFPHGGPLQPPMIPPQFRLPVPPMAYGAPASFIPPAAAGVPQMPYGAAPSPWPGMPNIRF